MSDIVERLRHQISGLDWDLRQEAADEIERLRAALKDIASYGPFIGGDAWAMRETARRAIHEQTGTEPDQSHDVEQLTR